MTTQQPAEQPDQPTHIIRRHFDVTVDRFPDESTERTVTALHEALRATFGPTAVPAVICRTESPVLADRPDLLAGVHRLPDHATSEHPAALTASAEENGPTRGLTGIIPTHPDHDATPPANNRWTDNPDVDFPCCAPTPDTTDTTDTPGDDTTPEPTLPTLGDVRTVVGSAPAVLLSTGTELYALLDNADGNAGVDAMSPLERRLWSERLRWHGLQLAREDTDR